MCIGTPLCFSTNLQRETTLVTSCLLLWTKNAIQNRVYFLRKEFAPMGANSFLKKPTPVEKKGKSKTGIH